MPPTDEMIEKVLTSVKKETDRQYFFSRLTNPLWIGPLHERGYFKSPPDVKQLSDGYVQYPPWPELRYLATVAEEAADQVVEIVLSLPKTDNPSVYDNILEIALKLYGRKSAELLPKIIEYIELNNSFLAYRYPELLQHWTTQGNIDEALEIVKLLIPFQEDPKIREKRQRRRKQPDSAGIFLNPTPHLSQWEYQEILKKGVSPLAEHAPYQVAVILAEAVEKMIRLKMYIEDIEKADGEDYSELWCRRLDTSERNHQDDKTILVQTLTYACEQVYNKAPEFIASLDRTLRNYRWKMFKRLRQYLYSLYPTSQTLPWIHEQILEYEDYHKRKYRYEFQIMIRKASEHFGSQLLSDDEQKNIFDAILSGPSKDEFREWLGDRYSEDAFQRRQYYFHQAQLRPFASLLSGDILHYFDTLESEIQAEDITDDSYSPYGPITSGTISYRSPKSTEELESLTDENLLAYLNQWSEEHRDKENWLVEINISALANTFQSLFREDIVQNAERLSFWMANRDKIARPIYVATIVKALTDFIKEKQFNNLDQWIKFCSWVLSHPDAERAEGRSELREESAEYPDWGSSRSAVIDFIDTCVNKDTNVPFNARKGIFGLLQQICSQPDWRLDHNQQVFLNQNDPLMEAINNTRSRALESLINFGFWIRRYSPDDDLSDIISILEQRIVNNAEIPLTRPERALLGMHFGNICSLNQSWAIEHREVFFQKENRDLWQDAFSNYIRFNRPVKPIFEILRDEFEYAIEHLNTLLMEESDTKELIDRLGQHLFTYYLWEAYPLLSDDSLLGHFYDKTNDDRERWIALFDHIGRSLKNSGKDLEKALIERVIAFFDWRLEAAYLPELHEFSFWLESECLDPNWRLKSYLKILSLSQGKIIRLSLHVRALGKLLPNHLDLVVECFTKITDAIDQSSQMYISTNEAKPILKAGLNANNSQTRKNAERARENLLQLGRFDYLDVEST